MHTKQGSEQFDHVLGPDAAGHQDRVRLSGTLVQHRQQFQPSPVFRLIHHEIVTPDLVLVLGASALTLVLAAAQPLSCPLRLRDAQSSVPPEPLHPCAIDAPPVPAQEGPRSADTRTGDTAATASPVARLTLGPAPACTPYTTGSIAVVRAPGMPDAR